MVWEKMSEMKIEGIIPKEAVWQKDIYVGNRLIKVARYYNANYFAIAVVGVVTLINNEPFDWACYIGATPSDYPYVHTIEYVWKYGVKLSEKEARFYFPELKNVPYRP